MKFWFLYLLVLLTPYCLSQERKRRSNSGVRQKKALEEWAKYLEPKRDYNETLWRSQHRSKSPSDYFHAYADKLTQIFKKNRAIVNFALIGACDGITDPTIKYRFFKYPNWRAVFVEPMKNNIDDLKIFLEKNGALNRSLIIRAAATSECTTPTLTVERPLYEEKTKANPNKTIPHWLRRQIGSILPAHRDHPRPEWTTEEVRCVTASDILSDWGKTMGSRAKDIAASGKTRKRRPHILKIDVEGHDYQVLMSFMLEETPVYEQPLLIEFEAKSIAKKFPMAKEHMQKKGYIVSHFASDGFALLKGERILEGIVAADGLKDRAEGGGKGDRIRKKRTKGGKSSKKLDDEVEGNVDAETN